MKELGLTRQARVQLHGARRRVKHAEAALRAEKYDQAGAYLDGVGRVLDALLKDSAVLDPWKRDQQTDSK